MLEEEDLAERARFLKAREVIDNTPALFAGSVRRMMENERRLIAEIARREGSGNDDLLPHFVVALSTTVARVGFEFCPPTGTDDLTALAARLEATLALAERSLRPGWDRPQPPRHRRRRSRRISAATRCERADRRDRSTQSSSGRLDPADPAHVRVRRRPGVQLAVEAAAGASPDQLDAMIEPALGQLPWEQADSDH